MNTPKIVASDIPVYCDFSKLVDVTDLKVNPRNPSIHSDKQIGLLAKNIRQLGWRSPIRVSNRSGYMIAGHGRLQAAQLLKVEKVPVDYQDFSSDAEEYAVLLADNRISELAYPDTKILKDLLSDLDGQMGLKDIELTGFTEDEWKNLMEPGSVPPEDGDPGDQGSGKTCTCPQCGHTFKASTKKNPEA